MSQSSGKECGARRVMKPYGETRRSRLAGAAMIVLLGVAPAWAAEPLTWQDCVGLAAEQNPDLVAAREQVAAAEAGTRVARSALLPQLSVGGQAGHSEGGQAGQTEEGHVRGDAAGQDPYGLTVGATQSLYSGGEKRANVRVAEATLIETEAGADLSAVETTYQVRTAFVNLLYTQEQTELLRKIRDRRANNSEMVELRYEGGLEHKGSLALSQAALYEADVDLKQAWRKAGTAQEVLRRAIGIREGATDLRIAGEIDGFQVPDAVDTAELARRTPEYQQAIASRQGAEAELKIARSGFLPSVDLDSSAGRYGDEGSFENDRWSVGLKLTFPFWPGGVNVHEYRKAKANLAEAEATVLGTENTLVADLAQTLVDLSNAAEDVLVQRRQLEASELRAEISREQYTNGLLGFENWDIIENDLIAKRKRLLDAQRDALLAEAAWWRKSGRSAFRTVPASPGLPGARRGQESE